MIYIFIVLILFFVITSIMRRPQSKIFWNEKIAPLLNRSVQNVRQEKDRLANDRKVKRWLYVALIAIPLIILALIFR